MWSVYLLESLDGKRTYVGMTNNLDRRLRQHNHELVGGAVATAGRDWRRLASVRGFPDQRAALQFEWRWKQITRKETSGSPRLRRFRALQTLLSLDRPTTAAVPYAEYAEPLDIVIEEGVEIPEL
jgi:predicted GIY-YIG superfamily endonuclease